MEANILLIILLHLFFYSAKEWISLTVLCHLAQQQRKPKIFIYIMVCTFVCSSYHQLLYSKAWVHFIISLAPKRLPLAGVKNPFILSQCLFRFIDFWLNCLCVRYIVDIPVQWSRTLFVYCWGFLQSIFIVTSPLLKVRSHVCKI